MNIVLVCLNNFQDYILVNIEQLLRLGHKNIYIITNYYLTHHFDNFKLAIKLINADKLVDTYKFNEMSSLDNNFRNGFWKLTSQRFFIIYEFMKQFNIENVIHLENDVLIYYNCDVLVPYLNKTNVYMPFDTYKRNIASIMYIPNATIFKTILDNYNVNINDMENFAYIKQKTSLINQFPIFKSEYAITDEEKYVSTNSNEFPHIFDAAAMGQYLGGVDPRNMPGDTSGFVNETCIIKYNKYKFLCDNVNNIEKPYIIINNNVVPIFNLHIHCKNLKKFC